MRLKKCVYKLWTLYKFLGQYEAAFEHETAIDFHKVYSILRLFSEKRKLRNFGNN